MDILKAPFIPSTLDNVMCRSRINMGWDENRLPDRIISTDEHCFGCTLVESLIEQDKDI